MGNNIAKHIFNLAFGQKQHVTLMVASRYLHSKAPLLSGKRMVSLLLVFLLSLLDYFTQKGRSRCTRWEPSVSTVETGRFHGGNRSFPWWEQTRNYVLENLTRGLSPCEVTRLVVSLLLLLVVGVSGVKAVEVDFTGIWYIANETNHGDANIGTHWYLVPGRDPKQGHFADAYFHNEYCNKSGSGDYTGDNYGDPGKPFLTTYQTGHNLNSIWIIVSTDDGYYNIIHAKTGKYIVYQPPYKDAQHRKSMHLESTDTPGDNAKFTITGSSLDGPININPKDVTTGNKYFNPAVGVGNRPQYYGTGTYFHEGMIGLYSDSGDKSQWYFEKAGPIITFTSDNKVQINALVPSSIGSTISYSTDGTDPTTAYTGEFTPDANATCLKAKMVLNGVESNVSYVPFLPGLERTYLIQGLGYTSAMPYDGFFLQPGDVSKGNITVTTSSVARPLMQWTFESAGTDDDNQYYYIVNPESGNYLYCNSAGNVYMKTATDFNESNDYKFCLLVDASSGFRITPKSRLTYWINKSTGHNATDAVNTSNNISDLSCRWDFISVLDHKMPVALKPVPFTVSSNTEAVYYKIGNASVTTSFIVPSANYVTTSETESSDMAWFFLEAESDDWLTYYYIVNAVTGKYMYFNGDQTKTGNSNAFDTLSLSTDNKDRYQFVVAKTQTSATDGKYYIVPKVLKDLTYTNYSLLWRDGTYALKTQAQRADDNRKWTFTPTTFKCTAPKVTYDNVNDKVVISSPQGIGIYYTTNGANNVVIPSSSTHYTQPLEIGSSTQIIRAVCARSGDGTDNSDVVTIIFNPDITLSDASVTYDGSGHQPTISRVDYNSTDITSECTFAKYLDAEGNEVTECKNAGVYKVVITDVADGDYYVYGSTTFTIDPITGLIVTPNANQSKEYGDPDPELTYTCSGTALLTGDELTGALSRDEGEVVGGTYYITQGTLGNPNYTASFTTGKTFTITAKSLGSGSTPAPNITCDVTETGGTHSIVVKQCGNDLTLGTDYTKDYESDGAKYYDVTVAGTGNYTGGFSVKLAKIQLSKLSGSSAPGGAALFVSDSGDGNFVVPDNMTAYIVTGINGNTLVTEQLNNIPDHVPVLLVSTIDANGFLVNTTTGTAPSGTNLLEVKANDWENIPAATIYLLYNGEFVLNAAGTLPAGKIYLPRTSGAPSRLFINWEDVTGIEDNSPSIMDHSPFNEVWYTLDGRRLNGQPKKKGLYLNNGKKVVIR